MSSGLLSYLLPTGLAAWDPVGPKVPQLHSLEQLGTLFTGVQMVHVSPPLPLREALQSFPNQNERNPQDEVLYQAKLHITFFLLRYT